MSNTHNIYLISDSTGETLDRIFTALKAQFEKFDHNLFHFSFTRTENQLLKILEDAKKKEESIILYTIVDNKLAKFLSKEASKKNIPCFGVLGDLILNFSKLLDQKATNIPSGQHALNEEYYNRIEAKFTKVSPKNIEKDFISMSSMKQWILEEDIGKTTNNNNPTLLFRWG